MLNKAPLLRILVPLIAGIILSGMVGIPLWVSLSAFIIIAVAYVCTEIFIHRSPSRALSLSFVPTLLLSLSAVPIGAALESYNSHLFSDAASISGKVVCGRITHIKDNDNSTSLHLDLSADEQINDRCKVSITLDHMNHLITEGDILAFKADLQPIHNLGNPEEFDYQLYMKRQGFLFCQTLKANDYRVVGHYDDIFSTSTHIQRKLTNDILNSGIDNRTKYLINTSLLGDASFIEDETRQAFSEVGIAHVLAISGLHMGIILTIITLLLRPLDYINLRWLRIILSIVALLLFLFITGASPSATRATIMSVFVMVALLTHRESSSLNAICGSGIIILLISPNDIYNIGSQLSFLSVTMIVLLFQKLNFVSPRQRLAYSISSSLLTVILANVGCSVVSAYYFHTLPLLSALSNLIIVPLLPVYMGIAIFFMFFSLLGIDVHEVGFVINSLTDLLYYIVDIFSRIPLSHIDGIYISPLTLVLYFMLVVIVICLIFRQKFVYILCSIGLIMAIAVSVCIERIYMPNSGLVIFNDRAFTPVLYFNKHTGYLWHEDDGTTDMDYFTQRNKGFLSKYRISDIRPFSEYQHTSAIGFPFTYICGKRLAIITSSKIKYYNSKNSVDVDFLIITKRYYGDISNLLKLIQPQLVVISGDLYPDTRSKYIDECKRLKLKYYDVAEQGALCLMEQ